jgi:hypothetical protein
VRAFTITSADIARCQKTSLSPRHYREDGTCYCDEAGRAEHRELLDRKRKVRVALANLNARLNEVEW